MIDRKYEWNCIAQIPPEHMVTTVRFQFKFQSECERIQTKKHEKLQQATDKKNVQWFCGRISICCWKDIRIRMPLSLCGCAIIVNGQRRNENKNINVRNGTTKFLFGCLVGTDVHGKRIHMRRVRVHSHLSLVSRRHFHFKYLMRLHQRVKWNEREIRKIKNNHFLCKLTMTCAGKEQQ